MPQLLVKNIGVSSSAWTAINSGYERPLNVTVKMRSGADFMLSHDSSGASYATIDGSFSANFLRPSSDGVLFYVKSTLASDTAEAVCTY